MRYSAAASAAILVLVATVSACRGPVRRDIPPNSPRAVRADARACDRGDAVACTNVAAAWRDGSLGKVDDERAIPLLERACAGGALLGCVVLSELVDDPRAVTLLRDACPTEPIACLRLGGRLADVDPGAAYEAYRTACEARILAACLEQGLMLRQGLGVAVDAERGTTVLRRACGGGSMGACRELARIHAAEDADPTIAHTLALGACQGGDGEGCSLAADFLEEAEDPEDRDSAPIFRARACELGYEPACEADR